MTIADAASLSSWELVADLATWAVIIGVAGEGGEIALKFLKLRFEKKQKHNPSLIPAKHIEWIDRHEVGLEVGGGLFWALVVIGLIFEWHGSHESKRITDREARRLTEQLEVTTEIAGVANERAGKANENAASLTKSNLLLQAEVLKLETKLAKRRISPEQTTNFIFL